jgi:hypothetical protein
VIYLRHLLRNMGFAPKKWTPVYEDNIICDHASAYAPVCDTHENTYALTYVYVFEAHTSHMYTGYNTIHIAYAQSISDMHTAVYDSR